MNYFAVLVKTIYFEAAEENYSFDEQMVDVLECYSTSFEG